MERPTRIAVDYDSEKNNVAQRYIRKELVMSVYENITFVGVDAHAGDINAAMIFQGSKEVEHEW